MTQEKIRKNTLPFSSSLVRRDLPKLDSAEFTARSKSFATMQVVIDTPGPHQPEIVSSAHGPLKHLLLAYPEYVDGEYSYKRVYEDLFKKLPSTTRLTILSHPSVVNDLQQILTSAGLDTRARIVKAPEYLHFSVWAEDPYVVVHDTSTDPATVFLLEPYSFPRYGDALIAEYVKSGTSMEVIQSALYFQGGNVLIGDSFVLIGADYPAKSLSYTHIQVPPGIEEAKFVKDLYQKSFNPNYELFYVGTKLAVPQEQRHPVMINGEKWTEIVYAGTGHAQPIFHIDMFVSLTGRGSSGKYQLLVGSPPLADELLERSPEPHAMSEIFDNVAQNLEKSGFEVIRNPLPITYVDDESRKTRFWYFATSNNCLVQIDKNDGNKVWLPTYGHGNWEDLAKTDAANEKIWQELGFQVIQLSDFNPFAQNLGSVHCIKKYLER